MAPDAHFTACLDRGKLMSCDSLGLSGNTGAFRFGAWRLSDASISMPGEHLGIHERRFRRSTGFRASGRAGPRVDVTRADQSKRSWS